MNHSSSSAWKFFSALLSAEIAVWNRLERDLWRTPDSATLGRYLTLHAINEGDPAGTHIQDIAATNHTTVSAASRLVDRLEGDGLVDRHPDPTDRRATLLSLTTEGRRRLEISATVFRTTLDDILSDFPDNEVAALIPLLTRLAAVDRRTDVEATASAPKRGHGRRMTTVPVTAGPFGVSERN